MSDVFISYKRENLAAVGRLVEALRAEGIGVWWDQDIAPNAAWEATIERELAAAKLVIVAWSPAAVASDNVKAEARWARGQGRLLQVFVEPCEPPLFFGERQGIDLKSWAGAASHAAFRSVLESIRAGLETSSVPTADPVSLKDSAPPPPLPAKPSIAVLPFTNLSGDAEQDYFADGMVVETVAALSRSRSIFVIASGSSLSFKGKGVSPQEAARQLGVRYVLEGSVRNAGGRVRITVQLIDATDGTQIWTNRFEDTLDDVFALQDKVALAVAGKIEPTVQQAETRRASARPTDNMGSYDLALRSLALLRTYTEANMLEALRLAERAIEIDPNYGLAMSQAAICHYLIGLYGWSDDPETQRRQSLEMAHRAIRVADDDATTLSYAAMIVAVLERDADAADDLVERALALNPGSAEAWLVSGILRLRSGEVDRAVEHLETAMRLDPMGPSRSGQLTWIAVARFRQERFSETVALAKEVLQQVEIPLGYALLTASYGHLGQTAAATEALMRYRSLSDLPIEESAQTISSDPAYLDLFLAGIALAQGKGPAEVDGGGPTP
jgi:adenylate cyclase